MAHCPRFITVRQIRKAALCRRTGLPVVVLLELDAHCDEQRRCRLTVTELSALTGKSIAQVAEARAALVEAGLIALRKPRAFDPPLIQIAEEHDHEDAEDHCAPAPS